MFGTHSPITNWYGEYLTIWQNREKKKTWWAEKQGCSLPLSSDGFYYHFIFAECRTLYCSGSGAHAFASSESFISCCITRVTNQMLLYFYRPQRSKAKMNSYKNTVCVSKVWYSSYSKTWTQTVLDILSCFHLNIRASNPLPRVKTNFILPPPMLKATLSSI